jgi:copper chaperone CopZ
MRTVNLLLVLPLIVLATTCSAQITHAQTVTVRIDGDCPMCEKTIERVGVVKGESSVDWDVDAKTATITFDSTRTDLDAILKRLAYAGYDNERYLAPEAAYKQLPGCCQYDRRLVHPPVTDESAHMEETVVDTIGAPASSAAPEVNDPNATAHVAAMDSAVTVPVAPVRPAQEVKDPLKEVFASYFKLKDALVAGDAASAKGRGDQLAKAIAIVRMGDLAASVHVVWMEVMKPLGAQANAISSSVDIEVQRKAFMAFTGPIVRLLKAAPRSTSIYLDHCPMYQGGADWLSLDKPIKNPFYGSTMLTCGSVKETIAK